MRSIFREEPCSSALNRVKGMPFLGWSLNPYMGCVHRCTFCYVRAFELRADRPWDDRYGASIRVKANIVEVLKRELKRKSWQRAKVTIGAATDPYQPAEGTYRLTRGCIQALAAARTPLSIITRSPLVIRDIDVLVEGEVCAGAEVNLSIPTLDDRLWRTTEPGTAPPHQRLRAVERLSAAGIPVSVALAPILPGLSDDPEKLAEIIRAAKDAGATNIWSNVLNLRPGTKEHFLERLARDWPEQLAEYQRLYGVRHYLSERDTSPVHRFVNNYAQSLGMLRPRAPSSPVSPGEGDQLALALV